MFNWLRNFFKPQHECCNHDGSIPVINKPHEGLDKGKKYVLRMDTDATEDDVRETLGNFIHIDELSKNGNQYEIRGRSTLDPGVITVNLCMLFGCATYCERSGE